MSLMVGITVETTVWHSPYGKRAAQGTLTKWVPTDNYDDGLRLYVTVSELPPRDAPHVSCGKALLHRAPPIFPAAFIIWFLLDKVQRCK